MWVRIKWGVALLLLLLVGLFLHYTLLQHDVVRVTNTYNRLTSIGSNWMFYSTPDVGTAETAQRDIRFIETVRPSGKVVVYRNEDTGWVWPPYFKYDSSNLQAEASNLQSTAEAPKWVMVTHYGWRFPWISAYPNAIGVKEVASPDVSVVPWVNIVILLVLALLIVMLRRMWLQFRERMVDPLWVRSAEAMDAVEGKADAARVQARGFFGRIGGWFGGGRK